MTPCKCCVDCPFLHNSELCVKSRKWVKNFEPVGFICPLDYVVRKRAVIKKRGKNPVKISKAKLKQMYEAGAKMKDICDEFGVSNSAIYVRLRNYGIKRRSNQKVVT